MQLSLFIRKNFYLVMGLVFWLIVMIGFSDNWLYDVGQPSNYVPKLIIHGLFAFSWFTIYLIQVGFIKKRNIKAHRKAGIAGMLIFIGMSLSTGYLFLSMVLRKGDLNPLSYMTSSQWIFANVLVVMAYKVRNSNPRLHKTNILFANLWLLQAAMDRFVEYLIPSVNAGYPDYYIPVWLICYAILFATMIWYYKRIPWQLYIGFIIWLAGLINAILKNDF